MRQTAVVGALALFCAGLASVAAGAAAMPKPSAAPPATANPDEAAFRQVCGRCHSVSLFDKTPRARSEWMETLEVMFDRGARGSEEQIDGIVRYLDANLTKLNINTADQDEIGSVLDLPDVVAAAVVARRRELGRFKSVDEIAAVPGVPAAKIEFRKSRIAF